MKTTKNDDNDGDDNNDDNENDGDDDDDDNDDKDDGMGRLGAILGRLEALLFRDSSAVFAQSKLYRISSEPRGSVRKLLTSRHRKTMRRTCPSKSEHCAHTVSQHASLQGLSPCLVCIAMSPLNSVSEMAT